VGKESEVENTQRPQPARTEVRKPEQLPQEETREEPRPPKEVVPTPRDTTVPVVVATPAGGNYTDAIAVTLAATDDTDPAPVIHYTVDGTTPDSKSSVYDAPIRIDSDTVVRFLAADAAGNISLVAAENYAVEKAEKQAKIQHLVETGQYEQAIAMLETSLARDSNDEAARELLVAAGAEYAGTLQEQGKLLDAQQVLQKILSFDPENREIDEQLAAVEKMIEIERSYDDALRALENEEIEEAYVLLKQVLELDPSHSDANQKMIAIKSVLVEDYSRRAMTSFRGQDLQGAVAYWDRVLEVEPENEMAKIRRAEALGLIERLRILDTGSRE
jgi:tetratricopeptide (TPR) repeat protein